MRCTRDYFLTIMVCAWDMAFTIDVPSYTGHHSLDIMSPTSLYTSLIWACTKVGINCDGKILGVSG